jgi:nucleoside 2-deoxyribosyltransferase
MAARAQQCNVCGSPATVKTDGGFYVFVDCPRCGDFQLGRALADDFPQTGPPEKKRALASHLIRRMHQGSKRTVLGDEFFASLSQRNLPGAAEVVDNLLLWIAEQVEGRPGKTIPVIDHQRPSLAASIGAMDGTEVVWAERTLCEKELLRAGSWRGDVLYEPYLTALGWERVEELKRAHVASRYAFFARKFANDDLNTLYDKCLKQAVADTGYELRTVTQKAGNINALIEDEIRRCRFLIADLSDDNAGAYWEAGLAEGLGKPVIYICRENVPTHFDTDHHQTVRWDLAKPDETAKRLKAVIRNTLLGDAKQGD